MLNLEQVTNKLIRISKAKSQYGCVQLLLQGILAGIFAMAIIHIINIIDKIIR